MLTGTQLVTLTPEALLVMGIQICWACCARAVVVHSNARSITADTIFILEFPILDSILQYKRVLVVQVVLQ